MSVLITPIVTPIIIRAAGNNAAGKHTLNSKSTTSAGQKLPFVLPQQFYSPDSPFVRAHSASLPVLEDAFIAFVDSLNEAMCKNPDLQAVTAASYASMLMCVTAVGVCHEADSSPGVGTVLGAVVGAGAQVHAASERRKAVQDALEWANCSIFRPHGLEAS